jgi:hypothetical protein
MKTKGMSLFGMVLLFACFGCTFTRPLAVPQNIALHETELTWDAVDGAAGYRLYIAQSFYDVTDASFSLLYFSDGAYSVQVKAVSPDGKKDSEYSIVHMVNLLMDLTAPSELEVLDNVLTWTPVEDGASYIVAIDGIDHLATENTYDLSALGLNQSYALQVKTVYGDLRQSAFSDVFVYDYYTTEYATLSFTYNKDTAGGLEVDLSAESLSIDKIVDEDSLILDAASVSIEDLIVSVTDEYLQTRGYGTATLTLLTSQGRIRLDIQIIDDRNPYMISSNSIVYEPGLDIVLGFELYGGEILNLYGNDITEADFTIEGSTLTIDIGFVIGKFTENPERTTLILGYTLEGNDNLAMGYLFITPPPAE